MEGHNHKKLMCDHCPIEKEPNGACFDGFWSTEDEGNEKYVYLWKCNHYCVETDACKCPKTIILEEDKSENGGV